MENKTVVFGITGGIAAYKSADLVSRLRHLGARVSVTMTKNATEFVTPLTFQTLSANQVTVDTFQAPEYWNVEHVALAKLAGEDVQAVTVIPSQIVDASNVEEYLDPSNTIY